MNKNINMIRLIVNNLLILAVNLGIMLMRTSSLYSS